MVSRRSSTKFEYTLTTAVNNGNKFSNSSAGGRNGSLINRVETDRNGSNSSPAAETANLITLDSKMIKVESHH